MTTILADIALPTWMVVSQWTLLFALGLLVVVMYRQLGFLLRLKDIGTERDGLPVGEKATPFEYVVDGAVGGSAAQFDPLGHWTLLLFADPGCAGCEHALGALERLLPAWGPTLHTLVVTTAPARQVAAIEAFRSASCTIGRVSRTVPDVQYQTHITPFAYLIDASAVVRARGQATDESALRKIVQQADRGVIQVQRPSLNANLQ